MHGSPTTKLLCCSNMYKRGFMMPPFIVPAFSNSMPLVTNEISYPFSQNIFSQQLNLWFFFIRVDFFSFGKGGCTHPFYLYYVIVELRNKNRVFWHFSSHRFLNQCISPLSSNKLIVFRFLDSVMVLCTENQCMLDF